MADDKVLNTLTAINTGLTLATTAGSLLVPLIKGVVSGIRELSKDGGDLEYEVVIKIGQAELAEANANFQSALDTVNAELERLGQPKIQS